ncbi:uncharacterized protein OCT59_029388 [Rhizophagus irregularis]|uniref:Serine-enriched protein n=3 Tax=Rhizophagus irregularis TaxID=588596 RepID=A0A015I7H3_RHIIW|nr:hypothetical protein GLOIN_2v1882676 [Rhizophagus irregularis DAOM 181602=DAOM 197198]EXX53052.1 hypothetical protein RirG_247530 [Rhizophagus irregularis DAOM 197198w]POG62700.1 hypothetical protein GLOIN_2v1882676 [Rhizophagus irregularis DAOM 181602=DAOM 197198]UZO09151.1 hypothetical protein OCT59_029388 [Rhizophagus irregularis]|eukprot:XP_025169566.1 hypothetical protein GLOIN_2v1882676 [Rhizophagus irregularis DAOM 181602=DAOM 197198]
MSIQFFSKLSHNYIEILEDNEYYDITIEVGKDPNIKIFRAHVIILCHRSSFLRRTLTSNKKNNDDLAHIKLSNISPETFQIILRYLYGGIFSLNGQDTLDIFKVLIAADELLLHELVDYLQKYLIENKTEWMEQHFELIYRTSFQSNNLSELQQFCTDFITKSPDKIFKSLDFTSLPEKSLISLIKRDDLQMKEIEVWEHVLKWGLVQNQTLISDPDTWTDEIFKMMGNTLQNCIPLIRFFSLSSKEFLHKVSPYKKLLNHQLYKNLLDSYMDPDVEPNDRNISLPRNLKLNDVIESNIVNLNITSTISRWIDKVDCNGKFSYVRELYLPYKFKLLLRGSRDGFSLKKFHELCDDKPNTVTFIKVKETGEILGGHNPTIWKSCNGNWGQSYCSFIFSFKNKDGIKDSILSRIRNIDKALCYFKNSGPSFGGSDLILSCNNGFGNEDLFDLNICKQTNYEKRIRDTEDKFYIEDYEVFQITKK